MILSHQECLVYAAATGESAIAPEVVLTQVHVVTMTLLTSSVLLGA